MENLGYYNGETGLIEDMKVPMDDRSSWFGDGVYDAAIGAEYVIFALEEHVDRFFNSMALLRIEPDFTKAEMMAADEVLVTSSASFCLAASHIDDRPVGDKAPALLKRLQDALVGELWDYVTAHGGTAGRNRPPESFSVYA